MPTSKKVHWVTVVLPFTTEDATNDDLVAKVTQDLNKIFGESGWYIASIDTFSLPNEEEDN